nr:Replication protein B-like protein [uncultured Mediterranean phage uvMED]
MINNMQDTLDIMSTVWANSGGGYVFLSEKNSKWTDNKVHWGNYSKIKDFVSHQNSESDIYWTPLVFEDAESRKAINVKKEQAVLFVDVDELNINWEGGIKLAPEPSIVWTTSKTRWQGIWLLDEMISLKEQQDTNRRLVYHIDADKGAWDAARVLRIPLSINAKRNGVVGKIKKMDFDCTYTLDDFDSIPNVKTTNVIPAEIPTEINDFKINDLPLEVQYWVTISKEEYLNQKDIDRSELLYRLATKLIKNNFSAEDIFGILEGTLFNKFKNRPETLMKEIQKAKANASQ